MEHLFTLKFNPHLHLHRFMDCTFALVAPPSQQLRIGTRKEAEFAALIAAGMIDAAVIYHVGSQETLLIATRNGLPVRCSCYYLPTLRQGALRH